MYSLKELRKENHYSQIEVADMIEKHVNIYRKYEQNRIQMPAVTLKKLSEIYNVSMDDIEIMGFKRKYDSFNRLKKKKTIKELRKEEDLTKKAVALGAEITPSAYDFYEKDAVNISALAFAKICDFFIVSRDDVIIPGSIG